jgi:hypothetical protein
MRPALMRPWQNGLAILAIFLVAGAIGPWPPVLRISCAAGAACIALLLFATRMRDHAHTSTNDTTQATWDRIEQMREDRARRR